MFPGNLESLCLGIFVLLLILLAFLTALAIVKRINRPRKIPGRLLTRADAPPITLDTVFKLNYYYPLPDGFAYTEGEDGAPAIVRVEDGISLPYSVEGNRLTFEEPFPRPGGTVATRTHDVFCRSPRMSTDEATTPEA